MLTQSDIENMRKFRSNANNTDIPLTKRTGSRDVLIAMLLKHAGELIEAAERDLKARELAGKMEPEIVALAENHLGVAWGTPPLNALAKTVDSITRIQALYTK